MGKFSFGKKGDDGDDPNRSALFGSRKKVSPAPQSDNPYARQGANDPYADDNKYANMTPYQQARADNATGRPSGPSGGSRAPSNDATGYGGGRGYGAPPPSQSNGSAYGAPPSSGYAPDRYGSGGGYGSNRYNSNPGQSQDRYGAPPNARGPGGYGGFGGGNSGEQDSNRDALFSGAQERYAQRTQAPTQSQASGQDSNPYGQSGTDDGGYGGYGQQRELTEEEQEEADYQAILAEKRAVQQESVSSVGRSVQMATQANEVARATLARLGAQGEMLHNTQKNLDLAANQNRIAQDRAAELKTLNRSMFAVHVSNPFTSKQRQQAADEEVINRHRMERDQRETTRREGYASNQRMESAFRDINASAARRPQNRKKDYGKFNLDDEEGADELEDQIDDGLTELEGQVRMMNVASRAIGSEVDSQNKMIDKITRQSDAVDDATRLNRERLLRIEKK